MQMKDADDVGGKSAGPFALSSQAGRLGEGRYLNPGPGWAKSGCVTVARDLPPFWVQFPLLSNGVEVLGLLWVPQL